LQQIDLFISGGPDSTNFIVGDIMLSGGSFVFNDNGFTEAGGTKTGIFGQTGYLGNGNLQPTSFLVFDPSDDKTALLSMDFTASQNVAVGSLLLATLTFNVDGLAPGTYSIGFENFDSLVSISGVPGTFSVTAVPEPSSVLALVSGFGLLTVSRYRKRKQIARDASLAG
jgi:hypothetical protein